MVRNTLAIALSTALAVGTAYAQTPAQQPTPPAQERPAPKPPAPEGQPVNIKVDLSITEQAGAGAGAKRTVSLIVADRHTSSLRSQGSPMQVQGARNATVNVDASPTIIKDGLLRLQLGLEYYPPSEEGKPAGDGPRSFNQRITVLMESGRAMVVSQSSDPAPERRVTVELTATILK